MYSLITESANVLSNTNKLDKGHSNEIAEICAILEDANSPVTRQYQEKLYQSVIDKAHIDFGDIPKSKGNIRKYIGYSNMIETLNAIKGLAEESNAKDVIAYVDIVNKAISNIADLSSTYEKGFTTRTEYVALEYNVYVYTCVQAASALIHTFIDYIKTPDQEKPTTITIKNTKLRADEFYFEQLKKFNIIQSRMGIDYRKMLESLCNKETNNFVGSDMVIGIAAISAVALSIVPITRELIYQIYKARGSLAEFLDEQAAFLEMNQSCIDNNQLLTTDKKAKVKKRQLELSKKLTKLGDKIRIKSAKSISDSKRELDKENKSLSIQSLRDEISDSPLEII
jgi:hypothetical protein